jgi:hypothetical protein
MIEVVFDDREDVKNGPGSGAWRPTNFFKPPPEQTDKL